MVKFFYGVYRQLRFFFGFFALVYTYAALQQFWNWCAQIFNAYYENWEMIRDVKCGLLFQGCRFPYLFYIELDQYTIDGLFSVAAALVFFTLYKAEELLKPEPPPYGGVHLRFKRDG